MLLAERPQPCACSGPLPLSTARGRGPHRCCRSSHYTTASRIFGYFRTRLFGDDIYRGLTDILMCLQDHPPSFTPSIPALSNLSCSFLRMNILSWGCQRTPLHRVLLRSPLPVPGFPVSIGRKAADLSSCSVLGFSQPLDGLLLPRAVGLLHPTSDPEVFHVSSACEDAFPAKMILPFEVFPPCVATILSGFPSTTVGARQCIRSFDRPRSPCSFPSRSCVRRGCFHHRCALNLRDLLHARVRCRLHRFR